MNDVDNSVVLIARDASVIDAVAAAARTEGLPVRHFESAATWLAEVEGRPLPAAGYAPPAWIGCLVCQTALDGAELPDEIQRVCFVRRGLPVILIAAQVNIPGAVAAMQAGATTVLEHPAADDQLAVALRIGLDQANRKRPRLTRATLAANRLADLNDGELAVLEELLEGLANKEIAHKLEIGLRTVELRRSRITKKMNARSLAELIRMVWEARNGDES